MTQGKGTQEVNVTEEKEAKVEMPGKGHDDLPVVSCPRPCLFRVL